MKTVNGGDLTAVLGVLLPALLSALLLSSVAASQEEPAAAGKGAPPGEAGRARVQEEPATAGAEDRDQPQEAPQGPEAGGGGGKAGAAPAERDPFTPEGRIRDLTGRRNGGFHGGSAGAAGGLLMPRIAMRGFAEDAGGARVGLLAVEGGPTYLVRAGDRLLLPVTRVAAGTAAAGASTAEFEIVEITRRGVTARFGDPPQVQVFR